ncbi:MAG: PAS-domain containing protein [Alphaproteobacteria bacterium]|nr:PAS-domain containing protein [Alphaproteobacteria bacterium]
MDGATVEDGPIRSPRPTSSSSAICNLVDFLEGADAGLALFSSSWALITCNARYGELFGYQPSDVRPGTPLNDLIRIKLERSDTSPGDIQKRIAHAARCLQPGKVHRFRFRTSSGRELAITRNCLENGTLVETVRELDEVDGSGSFDSGVEQLAEMARERMTHALEGMADGFALYDAADRLVIYNRKYVELNPHIADLIAPGASFGEMLREGVNRGGFNTGSMSKDEFLAWRMKQHSEPDAPYDVQLADGRWVRVHEKRTDDGGIVGIRSDITELKRRETDILQMTQELRRKNIQFDTALNNMIQGLCMFDDEQTLLVCNRRYLDMYGFDPEIVKPGIKLREIMQYSVSIGNYTDEDAARAIAERPDHAKLRERATLKQHLRDGRVIAVMHEPMPNGGSIATYQDITDLERHEERLREYTRKLEISNRELQDFAYVASHDLQEPLRKIEAFGGRLCEKYADDLPEEAGVFVDRMRHAADRMRLLIDDLLNFSRVTTNAQPFVQTDLRTVIDGVISDLQIRIEETGADIVIGDLPTIDADAMQMRQLFQNLIGNALKFSKPDRKPIVRVEGTIVLASSPSSRTDLCRLTVADNGIGFDNKYKDQIFTIFQRLHGRGEYEGTGIGLATCRKIVERHGGEIVADGRLDEGTTFTVTLPVAQG